MRGAHGQLRRRRTLGAIDTSQTPALTVIAKGQVLAAWVRERAAGRRRWRSVRGADSGRAR